MINKIIISNEAAQTFVWPEHLSIIDLPFTIAGDIIRNDSITFRSTSWCMFPIIWAGDILKVEPINLSEIRIGDIALHKHAGRAYAHRLISIYEEGGRSYIVTGGENEYRKSVGKRRGRSGGVPADNLMGRVVEIKRRGAWFKPGTFKMDFKAQITVRAKLYSWTVLYRLKEMVIRLYIKLQSNKAYRLSLKSLFNNIVSIWIGAPALNNAGEINNFHIYIPYDKFLKSPVLDHNTYNISARICGYPIGNIGILYKKTDGRNIGEIRNFIVRTPFRGGGVGQKLLQHAMAICQMLHLEETRVIFSGNDKTALGLFKKFSFEKDDGLPLTSANL